VTCVRDPRTDATVFIGWIPDESSAVLSFRGTASRSDALADLKFLPRQIEFLPELFPGATAHLGFLTHFTGLTSATDEERNVATALLKLTGGKIPARVICTGHSMGGALACLGATWSALQFPTAEIRCITFGAPRVGNSRFIRAFKTLVGMRMRVVHGADPVPAVPPPLRYSHFQPTVFLRKNKLEWRPEGWHRRLALALGDHHMLKYIASVAAVAAEGKEIGQKGLSEDEMEQRKVGEGEAEQREGREMAAVAAAVTRAPWTWLQALGSSEV
jgi:Lipase (class 3)